MDASQEKLLEPIDIGDPLADTIAEIRTSQGVVPYYSQLPEDQGQQPPHEYSTLKQIYLFDPIISTAVNLKSELVLSSGWGFRGDNKRAIEKAYKEFDRLNMYEVLLNFLKQTEVYGDAYLEPRFEEMSFKVKEVWAIETSLTRIVYDKNGKVEGYVQVDTLNQKPIKDMPRWGVDELFHYSEDMFGSNVYSFSPLAPMSTQLSNRTFGNSYIMQLFKNLPPKMMHILTNASDAQSKNYKQNLQAAKSNVNQDLVLFTTSETTKVEVKPIEIQFNENGLTDILNYVREEVLTKMRVPPALLGLSQSQGRTEPQMFLLSSAIKTKQNRVAKFINKNLMPLLGLGTIEFFLKPPMLDDATKVMTIARNMIDAGIKNENGEEPALLYLKDNGIDIPEGTELSDPKEKDIDTMQSRQRKGMKQGKEEKDNRNEKGDSEESKAKLEKAQVRSAETVKEEALKMGDFDLYRKALNGKV